MEQQIVNEENKKVSADIFQEILDNPLINQVSNTVINAFSEHIKNSNNHEDNDKQQDSGVDDIEEAFKKVNATDKDNLSDVEKINNEKNEEIQKKEHNPINDFFNNQFGSQIGGIVGNITTNVIDTVKHELIDESFDHVQENNRNKTPEPTKEDFVVSDDHEKHPQEPSSIDLNTIITSAQNILATHGDKIHDVVQSIIPSITKEDHQNEAPQEPQVKVTDKSEGNSSNIPIPKVDIIAPSPLPTEHNENTPFEPVQDITEPIPNNIVDEVQEEFSCVKIKGYTSENNNIEDLVDLSNNITNKQNEDIVKSNEEIKEPLTTDINEEILLKKGSLPDNENALVNHEISIHSHEEIKHDEPFIEIKQEIEEKVQIPPPVSVPIQAEIKKSTPQSNNKKTTTPSTKPRIPSGTTTTKSLTKTPAPTKTPVSTKPITIPKTSPSKSGSSRVTGTDHSSVKSTVTTSNDKVPSYARPTGASQRASTIGTKSPSSTQSPSKVGSSPNSSSIRPLPRITNKYKDVKSKVFSTITTTVSSTEKPAPKSTPKSTVNGIKPLPKTKLNWKAESKVGSFANIQHKPSGGQVKLINQKLNWNASSKVGSIDNSSKNKTSNNKPVPPNTKVGNVKGELPGNINPLNATEALGQ
ncbi:Microtubule associated protein, tubulin-binding repeat-containing protein [Strongyloides ratti]|uniref:Microtubule associated protein, tubulin-binding repeat-containing protein n=1 Tax=Strongyloides ratti TaxID=34506 RepID=A0A090LDA5_STRRB|nr:Microtubule associated protein, tubulin-binding repeat-containing protein [Strongyloides ratti]CEF67756.1 Microtubule associated protein, tubulin-binding repeat-containing protein [Strongyloides ratti]